MRRLLSVRVIPRTMKCLIVFCVLVATALCEPPKPLVYFVAVPTEKTEGKDLAKITEEVMAKLRQQEGSDFGQYHVYLPDGRLQKVQYTTAPIKEAEEPQKPFFLVSKQVTQAYKVQPIYVEEKQEKQEEKEVKPANYVASIQYTDVAPIQGPVYSYNPEPLKRIVRYAPLYQ